MELDDFSDIEPLNFRNEKDFLTSLDEILESTRDNNSDWKRREKALKKIGSISLGNFGNTQQFIKFFNQKLYLNLIIQILDLRSSLVKDACRIAILCSKVFGNHIESSIEKIISGTCLYKLVASANKLISETGAQSIKFIIKNLESVKLIQKILDQMKNKSPSTRIKATQHLNEILKIYSINTINKILSNLEEFIKCMIHDANGEVRSNARKLFFIFNFKFPTNAARLFNSFEIVMQKVINEEIKFFKYDSENEKLKEEDLLYNNNTEQTNESTEHITQMNKIPNNGNIVNYRKNNNSETFGLENDKNLSIPVSVKNSNRLNNNQDIYSICTTESIQQLYTNNILSTNVDKNCSNNN